MRPILGRWDDPAWLRRANAVLILVMVLGGSGLAFRAMSRRATQDLRVPGTYVKVRDAGGGTAEARSFPEVGWVGGRGTPRGPVEGVGDAVGRRVTLEVELADVASVARFIEEKARVRIAVPCPVPRRVSLRAREASVEAALEAVAAAAQVALGARGGAFVLDGCRP